MKPNQIPLLIVFYLLLCNTLYAQKSNVLTIKPTKSATINLKEIKNVSATIKGDTTEIEKPENENLIIPRRNKIAAGKGGNTFIVKPEKKDSNVFKMIIIP